MNMFIKLNIINGKKKKLKRENDKREKDLKRLKTDLNTEQNIIGEKRIRYDDDNEEEEEDIYDDDDDDDEDKNNDNDDVYNREDDSFKRYLSKHTSKTTTMDT